MTQPYEWRSGPRSWPQQRQWEEAVNKVAAGPALRPVWPGGARVAVALSFDSDHECVTLRDGPGRPSLLSQGTYGSRVGVPRLLALLEEFSAPASFFVPAVSGLLHPDDIRACVDHGHEIALHGWIHERNVELSAATEREVTLRAADALELLAGRRPVGLRCPSWDFSDSTLSIIEELGLAYDSSLMADDDCYEILAAGRRTGVIEVPCDWIRDDFVYQGLNLTTGTLPRVAPEQSFAIYRDEFDAAYADGGLFQLTMHPHVTGHRSRMVWLRRLLEHIAGHDGVWFATHEQVAATARGCLEAGA